MDGAARFGGGRAAAVVRAVTAAAAGAAVLVVAGCGGSAAPSHAARVDRSATREATRAGGSHAVVIALENHEAPDVLRRRSPPSP